MASRRQNQPTVQTNKPQIRSKPLQNGRPHHEIPTTKARPKPAQRKSLIEPLDSTQLKKATISHRGFEYQVMPVEIEKDAELGLVLGQIEGEKWVFIDEILPNGMIDTHGILKEGDYLTQVGGYSLVGIDVTTALLLMERAYDEGRKTVSFVAARQQKPDLTEKQTGYERKRAGSKVQSFVSYENNEDDDDDDEPEDGHYSNKKAEMDETQF